jgi:2-keto-4-pentenoate hydratase/2-oxohepta-3-ene-1,7-dioic acid hydratase in catechol pathway
MKLLSFRHQGIARFGAIARDGNIVDLSDRLKGRVSDLQGLLAQDAVAEVANWLQDCPSDLALADVELLPVIPHPGKIVCVGLNYHDHVIETGRQVTSDPPLFVRVAESQVGHGQAIVLPRESERLDYEGEIAIVIGRDGRRISEHSAWEHVAGYACYNDGSVRDWQQATPQWTAGKNFPSTGAFGPWMVTADEIPPETVLTLVTRVNGVEVQRARTNQLIHSLPRLLAFISTVMPLAPGDVIVTGTPGGVGARRSPPLWLKHGDTVEVEVSHVGVLSNVVRHEDAI